MVNGFNIIRHLVKTDFFSRPHYAYGVMLATLEAQHVGAKEVTLIEFGVAQGHGLVSLIEIAEYFTVLSGMKYRIIGFDSGVGLINIDSYRDHPELWALNQFSMTNREELMALISGKAEVIFGDIAETVPQFIANNLSSESPIGFVVMDVDNYGACAKSLEVFLADKTDSYLPAIPMYVDDIEGVVVYNDWCGEALAINEFNSQHELVKIQKKIVRKNSPPQTWHHHFYFCNFLDHDVRAGRKSCVPFEINVDNY